MKKTLLTLAMFVALSASAVEVGVYGSRSLAGSDVNAGGISVSQPVGPVKATMFVDRTLNKAVDVTRVGALASYDVVKFGPVSVNAQAGAARLINLGSADGYALITGVGASYALTKNVSLNADLRNQRGQARVANQNGNSVSLGASYAF